MSQTRKLAGYREELLQLLRDGGPMTSGQLYDKSLLCTDRQQVYQAMYELRTAGYIETEKGVHSVKTSAAHVQDTKAIAEDIERQLDEQPPAQYANPKHLQPQPSATPFRCAITSDACLLLQGATINENGFVELNAENTNTLFAYLDRTLKLEQPS